MVEVDLVRPHDVPLLAVLSHGHPGIKEHLAGQADQDRVEPCAATLYGAQQREEKVEVFIDEPRVVTQHLEMVGFAAILIPLPDLAGAEVVGDDLRHGVWCAELGVDAVAVADDGPLGLDGRGTVIPLDVKLPRHLVQLGLAELVDLVPPAQQLQPGEGVPG